MKKGIREYMGLKFVITLSAWIALLMAAGTVFAVRLIVDSRERDVRARAREMGTVLAKATIDQIVAGDLIALNILVEDVVRSPDIVCILFTNPDGLAITGARASFNRRNPDVQKIIERLKTEDVQRIAAAVREELAPLETAVDILLDGTRLGQVRISFSREAVRSGTTSVVLLLLGTSVVIVLTLSALTYFMVDRMIVAPTRAAEAVATRIARGDLTEHVRVSTSDEIGSLGRGLNGMIAGLKDMIGSVRDAARRLETVSSDVAGVSANIAAASAVQSESVEEAASSVNEMHFSLKEIAGSVEDLSVTTEQTTSAVIETAASIP
jgi:methyl-accepting chemotaxis protein